MPYSQCKVALLLAALGSPMIVAASYDTASMNSDVGESAVVELNAIDEHLVTLNRHVPLSAISPNTLKNFVNVIDLVRNRYVDEVNDEELFVNAMSGMLTKLDKNAEFLDETAFQNLQSFTEGAVADVGIEAFFSDKEGHWVISRIIPNSSADAAGIQVDDYVHEIGEKKLTNSMTVNDVVQSLTGVAGSQIELSFSKEGRAKKRVILQRTNKKEQTLIVKFDGEIAQVVLPVFTQRTRQELVLALSHINRPIKAIVIDVQNNPGGVLSSAIDVASLFISDMPVVSVVERGRVVQVLKTKQGIASLANIPVVVLQNRYSASAAEVLSVALKEYQYATIMGETSYGKGSIQSVIPIKDGQAIKLTTARYEKLDGTAIDNIGVTPDVVITTEDWSARAVQFLQDKKLENGYLISTDGESPSKSR